MQRMFGRPSPKARSWLPLASASLLLYLLVARLAAPVPQGSTLSTPSVAALADSAYNGTLEGAYRAAYQAASKANISGLPICSRLWSVFRRPPPVIELPLSDEADQKGEGAFATFKLARDLRMQYRGLERTFSAYLYEGADIISHHVRGGAAWEQPLVQGILRQLHRFAEAKQLPPEDVYFLDVGANLGTITLPIAAHGFRVIAFEAMLSNALALSLSLCASPGIPPGRVTLINKGLGDRLNNCTLFSAEGNIGDGTLRCGTQFTLPPKNAQGMPVKRATIDIVRLDDALRERFFELQGRVGAVKMDVEGYEPLVVEGGLDFFREVAPAYMVTECTNALFQGATGKPAGPFLMQMAELGYSVFNDLRDEIPARNLEQHVCHESVVHFQRVGDLPWEHDLPSAS